MSHNKSLDGIVIYDESIEESSVAFTFLYGVLYVGIQTELGDDVEEAICEADARVLLAYLKEKLGD